MDCDIPITRTRAGGPVCTHTHTRQAQPPGSPHSARAPQGGAEDASDSVRHHDALARRLRTLDVRRNQNIIRSLDGCASVVTQRLKHVQNPPCNAHIGQASRVRKTRTTRDCASTPSDLEQRGRVPNMHQHVVEGKRRGSPRATRSAARRTPSKPVRSDSFLTSFVHSQESQRT